VGLDEERFELASLGDLVELLTEGWRIERMHYADRSASSTAPAAFFGLVRGPDARTVFIPDDGRALSHRALVSLFRESPHVWKHRSPETIPPPATEPAALEDWGEVPEPFPGALALGPASLREVVPVNQIQSVDGLDIALVALERHEACARVRYMCHASDARTRRQMCLLDVAVVDDAGRRYRVARLESGPEGNRLEGALLLAPAIPQGVRRITLTVGTVGEGEGRGDPRPGPWVFPIALRAAR